MATPTLVLLNHTLLTSADTNTGWTLLTTAESDLKKEGANSMSGIFRATLTSGYYSAGTAQSAVGKTIRAWMNTTNIPYMQTEALGGYQFLMYDGSTTEYKVAVGSDTYDGGWKNYVVDAGLFTTLTLANAIRWGWRCNHVTNAKNAINMWADAIRYLDGYYCTGGASYSDPILLSDVATIDKGTTTLNGYGVLIAIDGVYFASGKLVIGNGSTTTYFKMEGEVLVFTDQDVATGLYQLTGAGSGCHILINNSTIKSSGTSDNTRFLVDMDDGDITDVVITNSVINKASICYFKSGQTITGNTFNNCGQIYHGGADMVNCAIGGYEGTADTAAMIYNVATNPSDYIEGCKFTKGTAATHAIQFGTSAPTTINLTGIIFSGYNASDGQTDSTLYFADKGTDTTWTVYVSGCTGNISYKKARSGDTVNIVFDQVSFKFTLNPSITGYEWRIYSVTAVGSLVGAVELDGEETASADNQTYTYEYISPVIIAVQILAIAADYEESITYYTLEDVNQNVIINLIIDKNN